MSKLKLCYFNARGLAETSRLILAIANKDYEDYRYPLEVIDWKTYSFKKDEFEEDKKNGLLKKSLNKVPYLVVDDEIICQSKSIERFLANRFGLMGSNEIESAKIDSICECIRDFKTAYQTVRKLPEDKKAEGMNKWFNETLPTKMEDLEHLVNLDYSVGKKISLSDIVLYSFVNDFFDNKVGALNSIKNCPNILSVVKQISSLKSIQKWLSKRPETSF